MPPSTRYLVRVYYETAGGNLRDCEVAVYAQSDDDAHALAKARAAGDRRRLVRRTYKSAITHRYGAPAR